MKRSKVLLIWISITATLISKVVNECEPHVTTVLKIRPEKGPRVYLDYDSTTVWDGFDPMRAYTVSYSPDAIGIEVQLSIKAENLPKPRLRIKPDLKCIVSISQRDGSQSKKIHETETLMGDLNPAWPGKIVVPVVHADYLKITFRITNVMNNSIIRYAECNLQQLISQPMTTLPLETYYGDSTNSVLIVHAEEVINDNMDKIIIQLAGKIRVNEDTTKHTSPFLEIYRRRGGERELPELIFKTEVIQDNTNPEWKPFTIPLKFLCSGDSGRQLIFVCWKWDSNGKRELIGEFHTDLNQIHLENTRIFNLTNPKMNNRNSGLINIVSFELKRVGTSMQQPGTNSHANAHPVGELPSGIPVPGYLQSPVLGVPLYAYGQPHPYVETSFDTVPAQLSHLHFPIPAPPSDVANLSITRSISGPTAQPTSVGTPVQPTDEEQ